MTYFRICKNDWPIEHPRVYIKNYIDFSAAIRNGYNLSESNLSKNPTIWGKTDKAIYYKSASGYRAEGLTFAQA